MAFVAFAKWRYSSTPDRRMIGLPMVLTIDPTDDGGFEVKLKIQPDAAEHLRVGIFELQQRLDKDRTGK